MLVPSIFRDNFVDDFFDDMFTIPAPKPIHNKVPGMNVDVKETNDNYLMEVELPGYAKEDISADLKEGYLTISAKHEENKDKSDEDGKYIRKERYYGQCQRTFYVGENLKETDIKANYKDGILTLDIPKIDPKEAVPEKKSIMIEG